MPKQKPAAQRRRKMTLPQTWPASKVVPRKLEELIPSARNAKVHTDTQVRQIAASMEEWGWTMPILLDEKGEIIAGHGRALAAELKGEGWDVVPTMVARGWTEAQVRAYRLADNKLTESAWDTETLATELGELAELDFDLDLAGFEEDEVQGLLFPDVNNPLANADAAELPEVQEVVISRPGDLWLLGPHRILCGDCTRPDDMKRVAGGELAACILADPPYGMGKEKDGILNDNQRGAALDAFQMEWVRIALEYLEENGSAYVWGNAPDLWRLWYTGGLEAVGDLHVRNEIVWDKGNAFGMRSEGQHSYSVATERCLFLMRGQQFLGNQNLDAYWEGWEPLRKWLVKQRNLVGWKVKDVNRITETHMAGHWFGKSQFQPISEEHYNTLQAAADGAGFVEGYEELFERLFPGLRAGGNEHRRTLSEQVRESRTHFDNTHDGMTDVWQFGRVIGDDRFGHATPKPVAMLGRCIKSSVPEGGLVLDPFSGTGTVLAAAHLLDRRCYAVELEPAYVDVAVRRWQELAGELAQLDGDGRTFAAIEGGGR